MIERQQIIKTAVQLAINNYSYPSKGVKYQTKSKDFISYGLGIKSKPNVNCYNAIQDFMKKPALLDCERSILAIVLFSLAMTYKEPLFNELVKEIRITSSLNFVNIPSQAQNCIKLTRISSVDELQTGDWVYIQNHPDYLSHYSGGAASGEHVICTSMNPLLFYGLLDRQERTIDEWITILHLSAPALNKNEIPGILRDSNNNILVRRPCF